MKQTMKQVRLDCLRRWVTTFLSSGIGEYKLSKCKRSPDDVRSLFDFEASLTEQQLKCVNALIATAYSYGCEETRQHTAKLRSIETNVDSKAVGAFCDLDSKLNKGVWP